MVDDDPTGRNHAVIRGATGRAVHADRPRAVPPASVGLVTAGLVTVGLATAGLVTAILLRPDGPAPSSPPSARTITAQPGIPLAPAELAALADRPWDAGPLADPQRRASCLAGLGYPAADVLGAATMPVHGRPAVVLLLSGDRPGERRAVAVRPDCDARQPGLVAEETMPRP